MEQMVSRKIQTILFIVIPILFVFYVVLEDHVSLEKIRKLNSIFFFFGFRPQVGFFAPNPPRIDFDFKVTYVFQGQTDSKLISNQFDSFFWKWRSYHYRSILGRVARSNKKRKQRVLKLLVCFLTNGSKVEYGKLEIIRMQLRPPPDPTKTIEESASRETVELIAEAQDVECLK